MSCDEIRTLLDDFVDGELDAAARAEVEGHLETCAGCGAEERSLRALLAEARALPRELPPRRDLWPAIAREIGRPLAVPHPRAAWARPPLLAAAAAVLVALSSALTLVATRGGRAPLVPAAPLLTLQPAAAGAGPADLGLAEQEYERAAAELVAAINARRESFAPETLRAVDASLRTIDGALAQLRTALGNDPGNADLAHMLAAAHKRRVATLRRVARLGRV